MAEMRAELVGLLIEKHGERAKIKLDKDKSKGKNKRRKKRKNN